MRVRDARTEKQSASEARTALLTVWDADSLGKDYFQSGRRYMVRTVQPGSFANLLTYVRAGDESGAERQLEETDPRNHACHPTGFEMDPH